MNPQDQHETALVPATQQTEAKAVTKFTAEHGKEVGLPSPEAINYMMSVATLLLESSLVTPDMGKTPQQIKANALAKMLIGHEMKMQPMEALQDVDIVKGKIFIRYPQLINQILMRGFNVKWVERGDAKATIRLTHKDPDIEPEEFTFTIEDAKKAGLVYADSQYIKRPRVMLSARVISEAYRATGGRSNVYTPEEKQEILRERSEEDYSQEVPDNPYTVAEKAPNKTEAGAPGATASTEAGNGGTQTQGGEAVAPESTQSGKDSSVANDSTPPAAEVKSGPPTGDEVSLGGGGSSSKAVQAESPNQSKSVHESPSSDSTANTPEAVQVFVDQIGAALDPKQRKPITTEFLKGFVQGRVNMKDAKTITGLRVMAAVVRDYKGQLVQDPYGMGTACRAGWAKLQAYIDPWPADLKELANRIGLERYADTAGGDLVDYLEDPIKIQDGSLGDVYCLLSILLRFKAAVTTRVRAATMEGNQLFNTLRNFGVDPMKCTEGELLGAVFSGTSEAVKTEAQEEEVGNLFEMVRGEQ